MNSPKLESFYNAFEDLAYSVYRVNQLSYYFITNTILHLNTNDNMLELSFNSQAHLKINPAFFLQSLKEQTITIENFMKQTINNMIDSNVESHSWILEVINQFENSPHSSLYKERELSNELKLKISEAVSSKFTCNQKMTIQDILEWSNSTQTLVSKCYDKNLSPADIASLQDITTQFVLDKTDIILKLTENEKTNLEQFLASIPNIHLVEILGSFLKQNYQSENRTILLNFIRQCGKNEHIYSSIKRLAELDRQ